MHMYTTVMYLPINDFICAGNTNFNFSLLIRLFFSDLAFVLDFLFSSSEKFSDEEVEASDVEEYFFLNFLLFLFLFLFFVFDFFLLLLLISSSDEDDDVERFLRRFFDVFFLFLISFSSSD